MKTLSTLLLLVILTCTTTLSHAGVNNDSGDTLRIMTYNIKLLPKELFTQHHHPVVRAKLIPAVVINENVDVVVFEEAFDHVGVRILIKKLQKDFPYTAGFRRGRGMLPKSSGGVLIFSKYPIINTAKTRYTQGSGIDRIGKKGAIMAEIKKGNRTFQVLGTHMQAGGTKKIKLSQIKEMGELADKVAKPGIPQFFCGDFNISKKDTTIYGQLAPAFKAVDGEITGPLQFTDDGVNNDMQDHGYKEQGIIDYIFYRDNGVNPKSVTRVIRNYKKRWQKLHEDLSDHYALVMEMIY